MFLHSGRQADADMVLVPRVATPAMVEAAYWANLDDDVAAIWEAMVKAALGGEQRKLVQR
jgi:hypothetical protein